MAASQYETIRQYIKFTGRVQGVGFRYRAKHAADLYGLTGWVRNDWDGTVEMEVQGSLDLINQMLTQIYKGLYIRIDWMERKEIPLQEERGFHVRH